MLVVKDRGWSGGAVWHPLCCSELLIGQEYSETEHLQFRFRLRQNGCLTVLNDDGVGLSSQSGGGTSSIILSTPKPYSYSFEVRRLVVIICHNILILKSV